MVWEKSCHPVLVLGEPVVLVGGPGSPENLVLESLRTPAGHDWDQVFVRFVTEASCLSGCL